jgi:branched-subunit amino acid aminotransferase/4-amino-4-deoxychorismate lyase
MTEPDQELLLENVFDLQLNLTRTSEELNETKIKLAHREQEVRELLEVLKMKNSIIDRLYIAMGQGAEL